MMGIKKYILFLSISIFLIIGHAHAEEIALKNGDRISGSILEDTERSITINSQALGMVTIDRVFVERPVYVGKVEKIIDKKDVSEWSRKVSLGYNKSSGNTAKSEINGALFIAQKTESDELVFRASAYYSSSDKKMNAQKYYGMTRYAFSFGKHLKWYDFYKLEVDHDRFSNIDYRVIPATGVGYWFSDADNLKIMAELAGGLEYTNYRDGRDISTEFIVIPRAYLKKLLVKDFWVEQNLTVYVGVDDLNQYRFRLESSLVYKLTEKVSWRFSLIDEYDSDPAGGATKNDYRLIYAIDYAF